ncbi:hypothetical protein IBT49_11295 [Erwinia sp. S63]|uniref:hypothetical protein n=1 Tax=Erwinia sp. S63 TaxID=2769341 RepID=UPI00190CE209|nr:hypothetical protein [Erwinia sp. S63]MBK0096563.1 hypothetical protein [Erwinia sp. S63]
MQKKNVAARFIVRLWNLAAENVWFIAPLGFDGGKYVFHRALAFDGGEVPSPSRLRNLQRKNVRIYQALRV